MRKKKDQPQMSEFETLLETPDLNLEQSDDDFQLFNKPQTVKGIRKIDIEDRKKRPFALVEISEEEEDQQLPQADEKEYSRSEANEAGLNQVENLSAAVSSD